jgi:hypothetical protein
VAAHCRKEAQAPHAVPAAVVAAAKAKGAVYDPGDNS